MKQQKTKKEKVDHEDVFFSIRQEIITGIERIPNETARREGLFAHYNIEGSQPPIFWCFNNWAESVFLAHWLGPDQPLFAMRSLHKILEGKSNKKIHNNYLAKEYSDLLLDIYPKGPIFIGGNCQAAPISEAMAHYLTEKTGSVPFLITLEHQPFYCYPGYLLMLFGTKSEKSDNISVLFPSFKPLKPKLLMLFSLQYSRTFTMFLLFPLELVVIIKSLEVGELIFKNSKKQPSKS
jgi:hypothetical protein